MLRPEHIGQSVRLAGWIHRKRDHGGLLFIDLRDHYGLTQCVLTPSSPAFGPAEATRLESVISVEGKVIGRTAENVNPNLPTGGIEVDVEKIEILSAAETLPFQVSGTQEIPEAQRLRTGSRIALRRSTRTSFSDRRSSHPAAYDRRRVQRVPDADPDVELPARATIWSRRFTKAGSTRSRRRRSSSSSR